MQLNSCHLDSDYLRLMDHVHVVSDSVPNTVGVINRRCCCHLAKLIGLKLNKKKYKGVQCLGVYNRQCGQVASVPAMIKHRTPLPNVFSVIVPNNNTSIGASRSTVQVQGTADLMMEMCTHTWLGDHLVPMSKFHRKKAADFYHRNSMTAYCIAYGFKALSGINAIDPKLAKILIDWPRQQTAHTAANQSQKNRIRTKSENVNVESPAHQPMPLPKQIPSISCDSGISVELKEPHVVSTVQDCIDTVMSGHVFLGMIALQYQKLKNLVWPIFGVALWSNNSLAKPDVVRLIEQLEKACIRFVYFSKENELRSRVFAEKMGLEAGWNCHISLASEGSAPNVSEHGRRMSFVSGTRSRRVRRSSLPADLRVGEGKMGNTLSPGHKVSVRRVQRLGSLSPPPVFDQLGFKPLSPVVSCDENLCMLRDGSSCSSSSTSSSSSQSSVFADLGLTKPAEAPCVRIESFDLSDEHRHSSRLSSSASRGDRGQSAPAQDAHSALSNDESYDVASTVSASESAGQASAHYWMLHNRSQLPKGIGRVRPHLEQVDNVPLLVSLFTDCDHATTRHMVHIMQDYGECVLSIGSTLNYHNADIFSQTDCSISLEPLSPTSCVNKPAERCVGRGTATHLAAIITSIPSSLTFHSGQHINLLTLLEMARHFLGVSRSALIFTLSVSLFLSAIQICALLCMMPAPFTVAQLLLWLLVSVPLLASSLCFTGRDSARTLKMATPKRNQLVAPKVVNRYIQGFLVKFVPTVLMVNLVFCLSLLTVCKRDPLPTTACVWWTWQVENRTVSDWFVNVTDAHTISRDSALSLATYTTSMLIAIYLCILSLTFVAYWQNALSNPPFRNKLWCFSCCLVVLIQLVFVFISTRFDTYELQNLNLYDFDRIPWIPFVIGLIWCIPLAFINEGWKLREIKLYRRDQRRRRLSFGTKLGMNSPW